MSTGGFELVDNNLIKEADEYIRKHRLVELFEDLASAVAYRQPEKLNEFLIQRLELKKEQGLKSGIFTEDEARNIFKLFDLKQEKKSAEKDALKDYKLWLIPLSNSKCHSFPKKYL